MNEKIYPRPHDRQTVYLKNVIAGPNIEVGEYTIYNDLPATRAILRRTTSSTITRLTATGW